MVINCSQFIASDSQFTDDDFRVSTGPITPRVDGQRFWFITGSNDANKACSFTRDIDFDEIGHVKHTRLVTDGSWDQMGFASSSDFNLPTGAIVQVYTPAQLQALGDNPELPVYPQSNTNRGYLWLDRDLYNSAIEAGGLSAQSVQGATVMDDEFRNTDVKRATRLYSLNMHQAQAESLFTVITRLHPNGHTKFFTNQSVRWYLPIKSFEDDTIEIYIMSDDAFLINGVPSAISHGNIQASISNTSGVINWDKIKNEAVFWVFKFRYTIRPQ